MAATAKNTIPAPEDVSPTYAAALEKSRALARHRATLTERMARLTHQLALPRTDAQDAAVSRILSATDLAAAADDADDAYGALASERHRTAGQLCVLDQAIAQHRMVLLAELGEASVQIARQIEPRYRQIVGALASALAAAVEAHCDLNDLVDDLRERDVRWTGTLYPAGIARGVDITATGVLPGWFRDLANHGLIDRGAVPKRWPFAR